MKKKELWLPIFLIFFLISHGYSQFGFRHTNIEIRDLIRKNKLNQLLIPILEENSIDCWITITRDPCDDMTNVIWERDTQLDPIAEYIGGENIKVPAAFIFTKDGNRVAVVEKGDAKYVRNTDIYKNIDEYTYNREKGHSEFIEKLGKAVKQLDPQKIGLNFSEEEGVADGLTYGLKKIFDQAVGPDYSARVVSAEKIIISLWNRKVREEIHLIEKSSRKSEDITIEALEKVKPGITTARDIFNHIRKRVQEEGMEPGWQEWWCPTVTVGAFRLGPPPSDKVVERGDLIVINSGFLVEGYMSDINKVAYVLKKGEEKPPELIRKMFDTCLKATEAAVEKIKPGATGYEVDKAARNVVIKNGFNEYGHATGHTTGVWVHGLGIILGPPWEAYGKKIYMQIHEDDIYAVEPSVTAYSEEHGGNLRIHLQEMVIVEKDGVRYLNNPVKKLMLIK